MSSGSDITERIMLQPIGEIVLADSSLVIKYQFNPPYKGIDSAEISLRETDFGELSIGFHANCPIDGRNLDYFLTERKRNLRATHRDWSSNPSVMRLVAEGYVQQAYKLKPVFDK